MIPDLFRRIAAWWHGPEPVYVRCPACKRLSPSPTCSICGGYGTYPRGSNPPPPVGRKPLMEGRTKNLVKELGPSARPTSGPPAPLPSDPPWRYVPDEPVCRSGADRQEAPESAGDAGPAAQAPTVERWTDPCGVVWVRVPGTNVRVIDKAEWWPAPAVGVYPERKDSQPLTAEEVRKIVREEIERGQIKPWMRGNMGPG